MASNGDTSAPTIYLADQSLRAMLVLAHGAGAGQSHPFMAACARGLAARGIDVATFDFPYIQHKRKVPDKAPVLEQCFRDVIDSVRGQDEFRSHRLFIGGKSMGGRIATHLGAQGVDKLAGIVALGYPLHPPGKPQQLRAAHLPRIEVPVMIVQGERDTFGTPSELAPVTQEMHAPVTLHVVARGDHSLSVAGRKKDEVYGEVLDAVVRWIYSVYG